MLYAMWQLLTVQLLPRGSPRNLKNKKLFFKIKKKSEKFKNPQKKPFKLKKLTKKVEIKLFFENT